MVWSNSPPASLFLQWARAPGLELFTSYFTIPAMVWSYSPVASLFLQWSGAVHQLLLYFCNGLVPLVWSYSPVAPLFLQWAGAIHCLLLYSGTESYALMFVCWLLNVPATCECISGRDLLRQFYVLPHWDRSCRSNFPSHPVTVYWHRADQSQRWPYNARRLAG